MNVGNPTNNRPSVEYDGATLSQTLNRSRPTVIAVYPIAGRQLFFRIPESFCRECDLTVRAVQQVLEELEDPPNIRVVIRPWLNYLPLALLRRGWHPPVVTVNGKRFSQGGVPDRAALLEALRECLTGQRVKYDHAVGVRLGCGA